MRESEQNLPMVIFGAGKYARRVFDILKRNQIVISAACIDARYYNKQTTSWNGVPLLPIERIHDKLGRFNLVIGFYDILLARNLSPPGCEEIFFLNSDATLTPISGLPAVEKKMRAFFKDDAGAMNIPNCIQLYFSCSRAGIEFLRYNKLTASFLFRTLDGLHLLSNKYFAVLDEIFCRGVYAQYKEFLNDEYVLFDIGANRGYSSLYFSQDILCRHVFSFEPDSSTLDFFYKHLELNKTQAQKISVFEHGLHDSTKMLGFFKSADDADSTNTFNQRFINVAWDASKKSKLQEMPLKVYRASELILKVIKEHSLPPNQTKTIKIDVEGSEYAILSDLEKSGLLRSFTLIFGECHDGMEKILDICKNHFNLAYSGKADGDADGVCIFYLVNKNKA